MASARHKESAASWGDLEGVQVAAVDSKQPKTQTQDAGRCPLRLSQGASGTCAVRTLHLHTSNGQESHCGALDRYTSKQEAKVAISSAHRCHAGGTGTQMLLRLARTAPRLSWWKYPHKLV